MRSARKFRGTFECLVFTLEHSWKRANSPNAVRSCSINTTEEQVGWKGRKGGKWPVGVEIGRRAFFKLKSEPQNRKVLNYLYLLAHIIDAKGPLSSDRLLQSCTENNSLPTCFTKELTTVYGIRLHNIVKPTLNQRSYSYFLLQIGDFKITSSLILLISNQVLPN